jgi:hypothetical protein
MEIEMDNRRLSSARVRAVLPLVLLTALFCTPAMAQKAKSPQAAASTQRNDPSRSNIELAPAPKEGTREWKALEARKKAEQDRMDRAMRNVCRGC